MADFYRRNGSIWNRKYEIYDEWCIAFPADDERLSRYLRGETLDVSDLIAGEKKRKGWQLVMVAGHPLGFGKLVNNNLKNKYPAGWRKNN